MSDLTNNEILEDIIEIFNSNNSLLGASGVEISMDTMLGEDLGVDSLRLVQIMVAIEEKYNIEFALEDLDPRMFNYVSDLVNVTIKTIREGEQR